MSVPSRHTKVPKHRASSKTEISTEILVGEKHSLRSRRGGRKLLSNQGRLLPRSLGLAAVTLACVACAKTQILPQNPGIPGAPVRSLTECGDLPDPTIQQPLVPLQKVDEFQTSVHKSDKCIIVDAFGMLPRDDMSRKMGNPPSTQYIVKNDPDFTTAGADGPPPPQKDDIIIEAPTALRIDLNAADKKREVDGAVTEVGYVTKIAQRFLSPVFQRNDYLRQRKALPYIPTCQARFRGRMFKARQKLAGAISNKASAAVRAGDFQNTMGIIKDMQGQIRSFHSRKTSGLQRLQKLRSGLTRGTPIFLQMKTEGKLGKQDVIQGPRLFIESVKGTSSKKEITVKVIRRCRNDKGFLTRAGIDFKAKDGKFIIRLDMKNLKKLDKVMVRYQDWTASKNKREPDRAPVHAKVKSSSKGKRSKISMKAKQKMPRKCWRIGTKAVEYTDPGARSDTKNRSFHPEEHKSAYRIPLRGHRLDRACEAA